MWMDPRKTWKAFQLHSSRTERKEEEANKRKKESLRSKSRKFYERLKKASVLSKRLFLLLNDVSNNLLIN